LREKRTSKGFQHVFLTRKTTTLSNLLYSYASLNDEDTFREMRRYAISSSCERHRVYLHKPRQYSLLHT